MTYAARTAVAASLTVCCLAASPVDLDAQTISKQAVEAAASASDGAAAASFGNLFVDTIEDFRRIPSWQNVAILTVGGIGATFTHTMDRDVSRAMSQSQGLDGLLHSGEMMGGARTQIAAALATYTVGRISGNGKVSAIGSDLIRAQILTQTMTAAIKLSVRRTRPDGTEYSFPSGHSSVTFATATVLQRNLGWKVGVPAYGLATFVAASRVQDKRHFLSDVTFGAAIGIVGGRSVTVGQGNARFAVAPAPAPGGAAVSFTWLGAN